MACIRIGGVKSRKNHINLIEAKCYAVYSGRALRGTS